MLHVFRSNCHCSWKFHKFHTKKPVMQSFFLKMMKLYKDICSAWINCTSAEFFSHKLMLQTSQKYIRSIVILWRILPCNFGKPFVKTWGKKHSFHNKHIYIERSQTCWGFMKFYFVHIAKVCFIFKKTVIMLIYKTLPTSGNEKEQ